MAALSLENRKVVAVTAAEEEKGGREVARIFSQETRDQASANEREDFGA